MERVNHIRRYFTAITVLFALMITGCAGRDQVMDGDGMFNIDEHDDSVIEGEIESMEPTAIMVISVGDKCFTVQLDGNSSADAFFEKIKEEPLTIQMSDYGNFEKVGDLPWDLPRNDEEITTSPGDLILYQGNKITIYYDENTWNFTRLGRLNATEEEIKEFFGGTDDITAEFFLEWTE